MKWSQGQTTWEPESVIVKIKSERTELQETTRETKKEMKRVQETKLRPKDYREIMETYAAQKGEKAGRQWLNAVTKWDAREKGVADAMEEAWDLYTKYVQQAAEDTGITAEKYNMKEPPSQLGYRGERYGGDKWQTLYRGE